MRMHEAKFLPLQLCTSVSLHSFLILLLLTGCAAPRARLTFPILPLTKSADLEWFDTNRDQKADFAISYSAGTADAVEYDDNQDGQPDRIYRLADYANEEVPQVLILLDSIPYQTLKDRFDAGDFRWFDAPVKLIAPFPSLTEVCYSDVLLASPLPGVIDQYYDRSSQKRSSFFWRRVWGFSQSWERRCDYIMKFADQGMAYLHPREWFAAELEVAHRTVDASPHRMTIVYLGSASGMVSKYGKLGAEEVLDGARQLCLQLLHERRGAIKISMMADHGHNYAASSNIPLADLLKKAGFHPSNHVKSDRDVFIEINGLVTCAGIVTQRPAEVSAALLEDDRIELAMYLERDRAIVRSSKGSAAIEMRNGKLRYVPLDADVLDLNAMIRANADADGLMDDATWFKATLDHAWPNAPRRIWDALHRQVVNPPTVLLSIKDGYYAGLPEYEKFIKMASTHGGLNQANSATFLMTMTHRVKEPIRHQDVLPTIAPGWEPRVRPTD